MGLARKLVRRLDEAGASQAVATTKLRRVHRGPIQKCIAHIRTCDWPSARSMPILATMRSPIAYPTHDGQIDARFHGGKRRMDEPSSRPARPRSDRVAAELPCARRPCRGERRSRLERTNRRRLGCRDLTRTTAMSSDADLRSSWSCTAGPHHDRKGPKGSRSDLRPIRKTASFKCKAIENRGGAPAGSRPTVLALADHPRR